MNQTFRFIHAADIHLDSPLQGLEAFEDAPVTTIREATRVALRNLVELCIQEQIAFLLIAGDIFDGEWRSMATGRFFADQMARLNKEKIPVFVIKGNHDAASEITQSIHIPGVSVFDYKHSHTLILEEYGVAIHGQSYHKREVKENLSANYPSALPDVFNIGMLHTCGTGGNRLHAPYAPCTLDGLLSKGYDYWALGHVHQREVLCDDPPIIFPGNIQGRHIREPAPEGKGVTLVEVSHRQVQSFRHIPLDTVRWMEVTVDLSGLDTIESVYATVHDEVRQASATCPDRLLAIRLTLKGACLASTAIHQNIKGFDAGLRSAIQGAIDDVWLEEIRIETRSERANLMATDEGSIGNLLDFIRQAGSDGRLEDANRQLAVLREKLKGLPQEVLSESGIEAEDLLQSLLPEIEETILAMATRVNA